MYKFLLTHRRTILLVALLGIVAGFFSLQKMPITMYPSINKPTVYLQINHPSYTAEDFSDTYGDDIQNQLNTIEDIEKINIQIMNRFTQMLVTFEYGIDSDEAVKRARSAMDILKSTLPEESKDYNIGWGSETLNELDLILFSSEIDEKALYTLARPVILDYLGKIKEAESADIWPVESLRITMTLNPDALFSYGLSVDTVVSAVKNGYKNSSIGSFRQSGTDISLRIKKDINSGFDVGNIIILDTGGKVVRLTDIADIKIEYGPSFASFKVDGNRAIAVQVVPKKDGNLINLSKDVKKAIHKALEELPDHISYEVVIDPATFIQKSINNVIQSAVIGALLAFLCIILLIGEIRNSLIIGISIPLSVILAFILMYVFGVSLNLISLSGLALAVGMIVDASIVTMENIYRHREEELISNNGIVNDYIKLVGSAAMEVVPSIIGSTITSICVFLPLSFTSPLTANILGDIALTVVFTLTCSLLVAIFIIPLVAFYVYRTKKIIDLKQKPKLLKRFSTALTDNLIRTYEKALLFFLNSKFKSIVFITVSVVLLAFCIVLLAPKITREIIAAPQGNIVQIYFRNNDAKTQEDLVVASQPLETDLLTNYQGVDMVFSQIYDRSGNIMVQLRSSSMVPKFIDQLEQKYQSDDTWSYNINTWDPSAMPLPETDALHIRVEGSDRRQIFVLMERIVDVIKKADLYRWVSTTPRTALSTEVILRPRPEAFASIPEYTPSRFASMIQYLLQGAKVVTIKIEDEEQDLYLKYPEGTLETLQDIENFQVPYNGKSIPLKHFFTFEETTGISQLVFTDGKENYNIYASLKMDTPSWKQADYEKEVKKLVSKQVTMPPGYRIIYEDTQQEINEAITSLLLALALSVLLIYVALGIQFNSIRIPFIILVTIPFGFIGVILSLFVFKSTLSLNSMLGAILLCGIVVNNAIILIDFYLNSRSNFSSRKEAIVYVVRVRFRPVLITTMTTILGMLPIAFAIGDGANIIQPLGIAVSGGLAFSTFFTLFMVPIILNFVEIKKEKG